MNLIKLYRGNNDSVLALYENCDGYFVTETTAGWDKELIAKRGVVTVEEAIAYTDDIAQHCPACYKATEPKAVEFLDWVEENGFTFTLPPEGDGSCDHDGQDVSWGWGLDDWECLKDLPESRIWTVVEGDDDNPENPYNLYVVPGLHYVNRHFYLVLDQETNEDNEFVW